MARRGDPDALALLQGPPFPSSLYYLFNWFAELLPWCDGRPTWRDLHPWMAAMKRAPSAWELHVLKLISNAYFAAVTEATNGSN